MQRNFAACFIGPRWSAVLFATAERTQQHEQDCEKFVYLIFQGRRNISEKKG